MKNKYILFDGLTYNTHRYFASCIVQVMSKMSMSIIIRDLLFPYKKGVILLQFYLVRVLQKCIICPSGHL